MQLNAVQSSNLKAVGFDPETSEMVVEFQPAKSGPGGIYLYPDVSAEEHSALVGAPSIGSHFQTHFVKAQKAFTRLR